MLCEYDLNKIITFENVSDEYLSECASRMGNPNAKRLYCVTVRVSGLNALWAVYLNQSDAINECMFLQHHTSCSIFVAERNNL